MKHLKIGAKSNVKSDSHVSTSAESVEKLKKQLNSKLDNIYRVY